MRCRAIVAFATARGEIPAGSILNIPDHLLGKLRGKVEAITASENGGGSPLPVSPTDWKPEPKAWLSDTGELRTQGVFDDLAAEIIKLTADNLPLQKKLLQLHVGDYLPGPHLLATVRKWTARAAYLFEIEGLGLHEARWQAAEELRLLAWVDEWKLVKPDNCKDG